MKLVVDISDARVSDDPGDMLMTYSLGSCIGVALYDPVRKIGGMLHYQLPSAKLDADKAKRYPMMFADSGMTQLMKQLLGKGAEKKRMKVKVAGGAQVMNDAKMFNIGKRNYTAIRQLLWKNGMFIDGEDIGGNKARNMSLQIADGEVVIKSQGKSRTL